MKNNIKIEIIPCLQDNYSYLIIDKDKNDACVVDPSEAKPVINFIEKETINLKYILNTHHHFAHIGGNKELKLKYNSIVVGYKNDSKSCLLYTSPSPRDGLLSRMPSSA